MNHRFYAVGSIIEWEKVLSLVAGGNYAVVATHNCTWNRVQGNSCVLIARLLHRPREQVPGAGGTSGRQRRCRSRTWLPRPPSPSSPPASLSLPISICFFYYYSYFSSTIFAYHITVQVYLSKIPKGTTSPRVKCFRRKKSPNSYKKLFHFNHHGFLGCST